jgi:hypothetical protein
MMNFWDIYKLYVLLENVSVSVIITNIVGDVKCLKNVYIYKLCMSCGVISLTDCSCTIHYGRDGGGTYISYIHMYLRNGGAVLSYLLS